MQWPVLSKDIFLKMGRFRPLFYFRPFLITISIQIEKSVDGVLGIRTRGRRMVGADETTELWRPPYLNLYYSILNGVGGLRVGNPNSLTHYPILQGNDITRSIKGINGMMGSGQTSCIDVANKNIF